MVRVVKSTIMDAPADAVWEVLRDFNGHDRWHPAVATSQIERGEPSDIGCVRRFRLNGGEELREQLLTLSDMEQTFSYCLLDTPIPLLNYVAHVRLTPVTDGDRCFWEWESRFDTPGPRARARRDGRDQHLRSGLRRRPRAYGPRGMRRAPATRFKTRGTRRGALAVSYWFANLESSRRARARAKRSCAHLRAQYGGNGRRAARPRLAMAASGGIVRDVQRGDGAMPMTVATYDTLDEAARAAGDRDARFFGGGTLLMRAVNYADGDFTRLIRTRDAVLRRISARGDAVEIGAGVTMAELAEHRDTGFLAEAARAVGGPAIRTMATAGGNLFARHPYGDFTAALIALGATIRLAGLGGREMPVEELVAARERSPRPIVAAIVVPRPAQGTFRFLKVTRVHSKGVSVMSIAALLPLRGGRVAGARVAYAPWARHRCACPPSSARSRAALSTPPASPRRSSAATDGLDPPTDAIASSWYRREVAPVHLRRLLLGEGA